jgi:hypothetical protein
MHPATADQGISMSTLFQGPMIADGVFDDVESLHDVLCRRFLTGRMGTDYNWAGSSEVGQDNVVLGVRSFATPDFDLSRLWLSESRWNTMVRQYLDPAALDQTLAMVDTHLSKSKRKSGTATLRMLPGDAVSADLDMQLDDPGAVELQTNLVEASRSGRQVRRRWGSCMLALTYRNVPRPTVSLTSRTSYFGYLAIMDIMVANVFAQKCGELTGYDPAEMQFLWHVDLAQYHGFRCLAIPTMNRRLLHALDKYVDNEALWAKAKAEGRIGWYKTLVGYRRILRSDRAGLLYGDESFSSFCRVRRRFHTEVHGYDYAKQFEGGSRIGSVNAFKPLPALAAASLDFSAIGR